MILLALLRAGCSVLSRRAMARLACQALFMVGQILLTRSDPSRRLAHPSPWGAVWTGGVLLISTIPSSSLPLFWEQAACWLVRIDQ